MSGKRHHVVNRIATFIKIGHTTSSGRMEAYQFVFRNCHDGSFSTTVLLTANSLINTASRGKNLNDFVGLHSLFLDAFGCVAEADLPASIRVQLIALLSDASGTAGMVAGQVLDMEGEGASLNLDQLQVIHANKTGRLLAYPFQAAGILLELEPAVATLLEEIGLHLGLAFQIRDDILDVTADFASLGKTPQKDLQAEKSTYPALLDLDGAQAYLDRELDACEDLLDRISNQVSFEGTGIKNIIERLRIHGQGKS